MTPNSACVYPSFIVIPALEIAYGQGSWVETTPAFLERLSVKPPIQELELSPDQWAHVLHMKCLLENRKRITEQLAEPIPEPGHGRW